MNGIRIEGDSCVIGASATVSELYNSPLVRKIFPRLWEYVSLVSSTPIRNMATLAGNFINASPIGDFTVFFLALDARLLLSDGIKNRTLPLRNLYKGYKILDKKPEEFIAEIRFAIPEKQTHFHFEKVSKRTHLDIASVNTAAAVSFDGNNITHASVSAGGVAPIPLYLQKTSAFLAGKPHNDETIEGAIEVMRSEISPISDARGSKEYKTVLLQQLFKAHFIQFAGGGKNMSGQ
jgi:xanthine dehydrogenase small subunit